MNERQCTWVEEALKGAKRPVSRAFDNGVTVFIGISEEGNRFFSFQVADEGEGQSLNKRLGGIYAFDLRHATGKTTYHVSCTDVDLLDAFTPFAESVIAAATEIGDASSILGLLESELLKWEQLFMKLQSNMLSREIIRGVYGELFVLHEVLKRKHDVNFVKAWIGPQGANQDFIGPRCAIEVKTSRATQPKIRIANELQLDDAALDGLFLCVVHVDESVVGGENIETLVQKIEQQLIGHQDVYTHFLTQLNNCKLPRTEVQRYSDFRFKVLSCKMYEAKDDFPRIHRGTLANEAIFEVSYSLSLSSISGFEVEFDQAINSWYE
jgi:hypothetical protein